MARAAEIAPRLIAAFARPPRRPVGLQGPSGCGKSTLLRRLLSGSAPDAQWSSAFDLVHDLTQALREDQYGAWVSRLCLDDRVLCVEHVEDLRHTPRTREEFRRVLAAAARHRRVVVTLTRTSRDGAILRWLRSWVDVYALN